MRQEHALDFPVGFHKFHKNKLYNFTLNRWLSFGYARYEDLADVAPKIKRFEDWKPAMVAIAEEAKTDGRLMNAAIYYRSAEFLTLYDDPDKERLYDKFRELFYEAFAHEEIEELSIPYDDGALPAIRVRPAGESKGMILLHGGFDSFIEEFYLMMKHLAMAGYDVVGFEGPGQGGALFKSKLAFDHRWETPVAAILDLLGLENVTLFGLSLGGWLCLRAAAHEPRVSRVIACGGTVDYLDIVPAAFRWMFTYFTRYEDFFNKCALWKMKKNPRMKWEIGNTMHIARTDSAVAAAKLVNLMLTRENQCPDQVDQNVLVLSGAEDHFIPIRLHDRQLQALSNAHSVTGRVFTREDQAENHCQIGNVGLMLNVALDWLEGLRSEK